MTLCLTLLAALAFFGCRGDHRRTAAQEPTPSRSKPAKVSDAPPRRPEIAVVVHSLTGNTAEVGHEIAAMLGGSFARASDVPPALRGTLPARGSSVREVVTALNLHGVTHLFLGFPIHTLGPSLAAFHLVRLLPLRGIRVTPFFTYLHGYNADRVQALVALIRERGGVPTPPIGLRVSLMATSADILSLTRRTLLAHPELWDIGPAESPAIACGARAPGTRRMCRVPAGYVWVGDTSRAGLPPPRLWSVPAFRIDEGEITAREYEQCRKANACPALPQGDVSDKLSNASAGLPIAGLSFNDAAAYCQYAGLRLPTEPEWIRAGRGSTLRTYPWGDRFDPKGAPLANLGEKPGTGLPYYTTVAPDQPWPADGFPGLAPPCRFPAGRGLFGPCDLAGNLDEWVEGGPGEPILKGGSWIDSEPRDFSLAARGHTFGHGMGFYLTGARCAGPSP